jgi:ketopantoate hydroxymethyltransferase
MSARKVTVATLAALKGRNEKAVFVTAYDYPTATFVAEVERVFGAYAWDVRTGAFPGPEHCYAIDPADQAEIRAARQVEVAP